MSRIVCFAAATAAMTLGALEHARDASVRRLNELFEERKARAVERGESNRETHNESRKRVRLLSKVSRCSVEELMDVVVTESTAQANAAAKVAI